MPELSFKKAKAANLITEKDYERIVCMYLAIADQVKPTGKLYEVAAAECGYTKASFQILFGSFLKKLRDNNCYIDGAVGPSAVTPKKNILKRKSPNDAETGAGEKSSKKACGTKQDGVGMVEPMVKKELSP